MKDIMVLPFEIKSVKESDDGYIYVEGFAATYGNIDLGDDRIVAGAFADDLKENGGDRPGLWCHDSRQPIGLHSHVDGLNGLMVKGKYPKADTFVMGRVKPQLDVGSIKAFSIGYETIDSNYSTEAGKSVRNLKKLKLYESSLVPMPMNPKAVVLSVTKAADGAYDFKGMSAESKNLIKELADSLVEPKNVKDFPFLDETVAFDQKKSLAEIKEHNGGDECFINKLPFVYWTEKGFKAVPRAIYAACASLVLCDITDAVKETVNRLYKKLGHDEPIKDNKIFVNADTLRAMSKKEFVKIFDGNISLSKGARELISDGFKGREIGQEGLSDKELIQALKEQRLRLEIL